MALPRSGALPVSSLGWEVYTELLKTVLGGVLRAWCILWACPLEEYGIYFHVNFFLGYYGGVFIYEYLQSKNAAPYTGTGSLVAAAVDELGRTKIQAAAFAVTVFVCGPGQTVAFWVLVSIVFLWGGCAVLIGIAVAVNTVGHLMSSPVARSVGKATGQLAVMWFKGLIWAVHSLLYASGYSLDVIHSLRHFTLPWIARRLGETLERICWQHNVGAPAQECYEHEQLDSTKKQIRLLHIPRQRWLFWGHLRCTLVTVSMDDLPPFEALSYRWGFAKIPGQTELIFINGRPMIIPSSAYQLLHACSSIYDDKLVWIDAICINQTDVEEKSRQLPLMKDIYSKAEKVVVWPGDKWDSGMAVGTVKRLFSAVLMYDAPEEEMRDLFEDEWDRRSWKAMARLLEDSYFTRMWVIQEVVRGSDIEIYHGGYSLPWEAFAVVVEQCMHPRRRTALYGPRKPSPAQRRALTEATMGVNLMSLFRFAAEEKRLGELHIGHLLAATAKSQATDPRDKVFALSGLLSDHALPEDLLDYNKSASEVFLETAKIVLQQERDPFALFGLAGIGWESNLCADLPSWAVDWSRREMPVPFWEGFHPQHLTGQEKQQDQPLPASRRPSMRVHRDGTTSCVFVRGTIVDRIAKDVKAVGQSVIAEATATNSIQFSRDRSEWYLEAKDLLKNQQAIYHHTGQSLEDAFWRTIVADRSGLKRPAPDYFAACNKVYEKLSRVRIKAYADDPQEPLRISDYPELMEVWPTELGVEAEFYEFLHAIPRASENRRLIVGERGFLGLAPPLSQVSDLICLLDGGPTPFILREHEEKDGLFAGCYRLVGECYVHGLEADAGVDQGRTSFIIT